MDKADWTQIHTRDIKGGASLLTRQEYGRVYRYRYGTTNLTGKALRLRQHENGMALSRDYDTMIELAQSLGYAVLKAESEE